MFERFTDRARRVLTLAQEEARLLNHAFIGTEHILLGLIDERDGLGAQALQSLGVSLEDVRERVKETVGVSPNSPVGSPPFTPRAKKVLELSLREALQLNHSYIGTEHILLGLLREGDGVATRVLIGLGVDLVRVRQAVNTLMTGREETPLGRPFEEPAGPVPHARHPGEPSCPRCKVPLAEAARFRTMPVPAASGDADPLSMYVVYCTHCGTTLHMFEQDPNEATRGQLVTQHFGYAIDRRLLPVLLPFLLRPSRDGVTLTDDGLFVATFGLVKITTPRANVLGAHITADYRWWTSFGVRMSMADDGLTFGTNNRRGVCVHFDEKVRSPLSRKGHSALTVTVADVEGLVAAFCGPAVTPLPL